MDTNSRHQAAEVSAAARVLHGTLLQAVRAGYEKVFGPVSDSNALLNLVLHDPLFAWLRPLSGLAADLDARVDDLEVELDEASLAKVRGTLERWTSQSEADDVFAAHYRPYLQTEPEVVMAHAVLRDRLSALPRADVPR